MKRLSIALAFLLVFFSNLLAQGICGTPAMKIITQNTGMYAKNL